MPDTDCPRPDLAPEHPASGSHAQPVEDDTDRGGSPTRAAVLAALAARPGATVVDLADAAGLGRSTAAKALAALAADGLAVRTAGGRHGGRPLPDTWAPVGPPAGQAPAAGEEPADALGSDGPGDDPADREAVADADAAVSPDTPTEDDGAHRGEPPSPARAAGDRLAPGELRAKVAAHLRAHPGTDLSPYQISRALGGHSAGAVANALDKLVHSGDAVLASEKPRRYTAPNR